MRDPYNNVEIRRAISPVSVSDNTPLVSQIIDGTGNEYLSFDIAIGSVADADATFTVLVEDGEDSGLSDNAAIADEFLIGTEALAGFQFDDDNEVRTITIKLKKQYNRLTITPVGNASAALISATARLTGKDEVPVS